MSEIVRAIDRHRRYRRPGVLRVAIVAESFMPAVNGVTNSVLRITEQLAAQGHECVVIAPGPGPAVVEGTPVLRVRSFDLPRYGDLRIGLPTARLAAMFKRIDPDVVHLAAPAVLGAAGALSRSARWRAVGCGVPNGPGRLRPPPAARRRPSTTVEVDCLGPPARRSHAGAVDLCGVGAPQPTACATWRCGRAASISNAFIHDVDPTPGAARLRRPGETIVGFVGRLAPEKQVDRLVATSARPDVRVVVIGDGPERARLEAAMPRAQFLGVRHGLELGELYASFDVFAHAGLDETFCQAVQEALASGLPVVAPASGGPLDLVRHGQNGYLWNPADPASFTEAIAELARHPALRRQLGAAGRSSVEARPWSRLANELIDHYRSVSATSPARRRRAA